MKKSVVFLLGSLIIIGCFVFEVLYESKSIIKYELQTSEYFPNRPIENKYYIEDEYELDKFYNLYSDILDIDVKVFEDYVLFIEVREADSGSIKYELSDVNIYRDEVEFKILDNKPEIGTDDMAFWYFVAQVPKNKVDYDYCSEWVLPSNVFMDNEYDYDEYDDYEFNLDDEDKYVIITDYRWKTMMNDGGSHTSVYYNIDFDKNLVQKVRETYKANLGGTPRTTTEIIYTVEISYNIKSRLKNIVDGNIVLGEASAANYNFYTIKSLYSEINIFDLESIDEIQNVLDSIDLLD